MTGLLKRAKRIHPKSENAVVRRRIHPQKTNGNGNGNGKGPYKSLTKNVKSTLESVAETSPQPIINSRRRRISVR